MADDPILARPYQGSTAFGLICVAFCIALLLYAVWTLFLRRGR
ncbi:hypothetical protein [Virgisporangium aliadipatigenens]|nr:hypothetical protein [Virgisporangium aliadipatigenens]